MSYTMYTPLNVWLDPASVTDVVAYIQTYLSENTIYSETEIETIIHDYLIAHPELIGGVQSVNGKTGTVVLTASDINTQNNVTIESVLASLSSQISSIAASVATNTANITSLTGRVSTAETDLTNLKSNITVSYGSVSDVKSEYNFAIGSYNTYGINIVSANRMMILNNGSPIPGSGPDLITAPHDITITHNDFENHRIGVTTFASVGGVGTWSGWISEPFNITEGQLFKFQVKHANEAAIASDPYTDTCYTGLSMVVDTTKSVTLKNYYPIKIVAKDGSGEYSKIQDAVNAANDGDVIYIKSGWYNETVINTKQITLLGQDKHSTVLYNTTGEYVTPPLWTCSGRIENMTIYAWNESGKSFDSITQLGYALHLDQKWDTDHSRRHIEIRNCIFKSDFNDCIGCGIEADAYAEISDSICIATHRSGMKVHPYPTTGTSKMLLRNNVFVKGVDDNAYGLMFHTGGTDGTNFNTVEVEAYNNIAKTYDGFDTNCFIMNDYNYGNTLSQMNRFSLT